VLFEANSAAPSLPAAADAIVPFKKAGFVGAALLLEVARNETAAVIARAITCNASDSQTGTCMVDKKAMRDETDRLIREAMQRGTVVVKQGKTRIEAKCGKCGAPNRVMAEPGTTRADFTCKECGHKQQTL
jgi:DNA-directed RNA polymerase subunit RPC12/RpoP